MSAESMLPTVGEAPRCSVFARDIELKPAGTAIRADQVLVVDVPLPWPAPVKTHPLLDGLMDVAGGSALPTRLVASVPHTPGEDLRIRRFTRAGARAERRDYRVSMGDLARLIGLIAAEAPEAVDYEVAPGPVEAVLVCTQGSHDMCCGTDGVRLFERIRDRFPGVDVVRVSHLGGHRFAPTAFTFPDGRMWAGLDAELVADILDRSGDPKRLAAQCRGWWGAERGPAQVAEAAVFGRVGWPVDASDRRIVVLEEGDGVTTVEVRTDSLRFLVDVAVSREVPTIACRADGGLPFKPAVEYAVVSTTAG